MVELSLFTVLDILVTQVKDFPNVFWQISGGFNHLQVNVMGKSPGSWLHHAEPAHFFVKICLLKILLRETRMCYL